MTTMAPGVTVPQAPGLPPSPIRRPQPRVPRPQRPLQPQGQPGAPSPAAAPQQPAPAASGGWGGVNPFNSIVDEGGFPRVNLGTMYDTAKQGLTEETYNNAADAGFGSLRAGPYVASLNQNVGRLQGQMADTAANLAESEAGRRLQSTMQGQQIASQEKMQGAGLASQEKLTGMELGSRSAMQTAQIASEKERLGMQLTSEEQRALQQLTEQGRQYDVGIGQRGAEFGADLAFKQQQAEDQAYMNYLAFMFGGAHSGTQNTGRVVPGGYASQSSPSPFSTVAGPMLGGIGTGIGMNMGK